MVEFVSYSGSYPCLCGGNLIVRIDGKEVDLGKCLLSGGSVTFDDDWNECVEKGAWSVYLSEEYRQYEEEITRLVNENVKFGCCGGCV